MTRRTVIQVVIAVLAIVLLAWGVSQIVERLAGPRQAPEAPNAAPAQPVAHITATLFYATEDGQALMPVRREVPLADGMVAQGRQILATQLEAAPSGYISAIPAGTKLRAFYVTDRGDAFVDLSGEVTMNHPGGSLTELLTVYTVVNAVTANLPAVQRVQILVDGQEVDTIAGHVDVRRPLARDTAFVRDTP